MKKSYLLLIAITAIVLCSCEDENTVDIQKDIPIVVAKLASSNSFDTLTVIQDNEKMYIYEKGEYKKTIPFTRERPGKYLIAGLVIGALVVFFIFAIFRD